MAAFSRLTEQPAALPQTVEPFTSLRWRPQFATKFCSWHYPNGHRTYDSYAARCLWANMKQEKAANQEPFKTFSLDSLWNYGRIVATAIAFRDRYGLDGLTFKEIDKSLWFTGADSWKVELRSSNGLTPKLVQRVG